MKKYLVIFIALFACMECVCANEKKNLLTGDAANFDGGTLGGWTTWGHKSGSISVFSPGYGNKGYCAHLKNPDSGDSWKEQFAYNFGTELTSGTTYTFRFKARCASGSGQLQTCYQNSDYSVQGDWTVVQLTSQWQTYEHDVNITNSGIVRIIFNFGAVANDYYIDDIEFIGESNIPEPMEIDVPIREYAEKLKKDVGVAVSIYNTNIDDDNQMYSKTIYQNFNMVVAENEMKFDATEPSRNNFNYYNGDRLIKFAQRHNMKVRGHALCWHSQCPQWVSKDGYSNDKGWTKTELLAILKNHIFNVVKHFKGNICEWDVVNEVLDDSQSESGVNSGGYKMRNSVWYNVIGLEFLDSAFVWAHQADPDMDLYINDYSCDYANQTKAKAMYNLVKNLVKRKVPITGVGLQCHLGAGPGWVDSLNMVKNMKQYEELGLKCIITELDLGTSDTSERGLNIQADNYRTITNIFLNARNSPHAIIWGVTDDKSWRSNERPLLFDANFNPKPAYFGVCNALKIKASKLGDANNDGSVNVNDITTIATYILNGTAYPFNFNNADANQDGIINVNDITSTASFILDNHLSKVGLGGGMFAVNE